MTKIIKTKIIIRTKKDENNKDEKDDHNKEETDEMDEYDEIGNKNEKE